VCRERPDATPPGPCLFLPLMDRRRTNATPPESSAEGALVEDLDTSLDSVERTRELRVVSRQPSVLYPVLRVVAGRDLLAFAVLAPGSDLVVGRDESADLRIEDTSVSRRHALVRIQEGGVFTIVDLNSLNGTMVNARLVSRAIIKPGDELGIGAASLRIDLLREEEILHLMRVQARMRHRENSDPLTGLRTRQFMDEELPLVVAACGRESIPLTCVFLDVDHFKRVNDRFGHGIGDDVLRTVARIGLLDCRDTDQAVRYGGEEFLFVLQGSNEYGGAEMANRFRNHVKSHDWFRIAAGLKVTVSMGVAQWDGEEDINACVQRADQALYRAKRMGRDRVERASEMGL
jgi:diguanylate cyclase (GGDEF)-like protein